MSVGDRQWLPQQSASHGWGWTHVHGLDGWTDDACMDAERPSCVYDDRVAAACIIIRYHCNEAERRASEASFVRM